MAGGGHGGGNTKGGPEMVAALRRYAAGLPARVGRALRYEGELVVTEARQKYTPRDDGPLRASFFTNPATVEPDGSISVTIGCGKEGSPAAAYALAVHEHQSEHSPPSWQYAEDFGGGVKWSVPGTGPKFLEIPLKLASEGLLNRIAEALKL